MAKASLHTAANLLFFTVIGTALLAMTYALTRETIRQSEENEKLKMIVQIVPSDAYDNDIMKDTTLLQAAELLGNEDATTVYRGRINNKPSIAVLQSTAPDGYGGKISMIIAIHYDGKLGGVRVITHNETPGLGDYIEIAKNNWINVFKDTSLDKIKDRDWRVIKDGGKFEHMAGATITPRAVIKAVHKSLKYFEMHRDGIFEQKTPMHFPERKIEK